MTRQFSMVLCCTLLLCAAQSQAVLIDQYNFDDGSINDSSGNAGLPGLDNLNAIGAAPDLSGGSYHSDGVVANRLEKTGGAGAPDFTISAWVKGGLSNQGDFQGIYSNNTSAGAANSFQIDSNNGTYRLVSAGNPTTNIGAATANKWDNIVVQKFGGGNGRLFLNGVQVGGDLGFNPGGLQAVRIGANRNADNNNSFFGLIDNVQIFNDSTTSASALFAAGPGITDPRPVAALNYDASTDTNGNNVAEDVVGFTGRNIALSNVQVVATGESAVPAAYRFDGSTSTANLGNFESVTGNPTNSSASFEMLWRSPSLVGEQVLFELGGDGTGTSLTLSDNNLQLIVKQSGVGSNAVVHNLGALTEKIESRKFLHTVAVIDIENSLLQLYANGVLVSETGMPLTDFAGANASAIGSSLGTTGGSGGVLGNLNNIDFFNGDIGALRYYEGALNRVEVSLLAASTQIVPEPATGMLLLLAGGAATLRRRRATA